MKSQTIEKKNDSDVLPLGHNAFFSVWWGYCTLQSKTSYQSVALTQRQTVFEGRCVSDLIAADSKDASRLAERHEIIDQI